MYDGSCFLRSLD